MVNRLATPLPDSVLDRYYAEHPEEADHRKVAAKAEQPSIDPDDFEDVFKP